MITKQTLINAGWADTAELDSVHQHALDLINEKQITDEKYLLKLLKKKFPDTHGALTMRSSPAPLAIAVEADSKEAEKNLAKAISQMTELLKCPVVKAGALMPDACPSGNEAASFPVGGAIAVENAIIPAAHSSDICCSLHASFFHSSLPVQELMDHLSRSTRFGPGGRAPQDMVYHPVLDEAVWNNPFLRRLQDKAAVHIADQGDGNHFAFLGEMKCTPELLSTLQENGQSKLADNLSKYESMKVLVTHHGSRSLGATVYTRGLEAAVKHTRKFAKGIPEEAAWVSMNTREGQEYWDALQYLSRWTKANHETIHHLFLKSISSELIDSVGNEHNFVWREDDLYLHGKGATPAWSSSDEHPLLGLIPMSMSSPILLTLGANNQDYLSFSPHGAGRNLSRRGLLRRYERKRQGVDTERMKADIASATHSIDARWYLGLPDITETPLAYKDPAQIKAMMSKYGLANVIAEITPLGSIMAGRSPKFEKELTPKQLRQMQHRADRRKARQRNWQDEM
ncbi:RNA-splicing ligase RtcB, repairs tRNA damage [Rubritalea squalenifaciens DSM 18772]|uniref:3'-phosphate/5'-hydroxy nucleic acid ligase n=1 Tax=Rubritalea squalenifaciens DSM 18772 TaxID=1123071 RepID=A0A1M6J194_9BACT|nr:RtcB family protein [Rubritalea squalenifaciens]SHJ40437.1 RNA-splicing ligase RtcB, repairs tRNA damage [Rubritalea squalenifaciens DSM 18772]